MPSTTTAIDAAAARDVLTQAEAAGRAARVRQVEYLVALDLAGGRPDYSGQARLLFEVEGEGPLFLDFRGRRIERLTVNGSELTPDWNGFRLTLPAAAVARQMEVRIAYQNDFDTSGDGFHRFVDPEDGAEYVYTNFEPYEAHRLFPCFDQPDIKGHYTFDVTAPASWAVIANSPVEAADNTSDGRRRHQFARTELFSTYLVALIGGEYVVRHAQHRGLALGLYARRSMERQLDEHAAEIFEITGQGLDFYADLFDQPYPFAKYDQIFVPEYNSGAMENVGAVTYNEAYLFRDPPTENQRLDRAEVLLHELAHMWFGNLTTMRWWDDLWLNESFATYISYLTMVEATRFTNAWRVFNADIKRWAYQQDQLVTTHPIAGAASDTEEAFLIFDGITYGKGASVLKQLVQAVGRDGFRDGMRLYFRRHAWGNATLSDFLACLEEASGRPLGEWSRLWLETASVNTLAAEWQVEGERLRQLVLRQSAPADYPTLRPHALEVGLGRVEGGRLVLEAVGASIDSPETVVHEAVGRAAPALVFPNHNDHAYAKVALDARSLGYVREGLGRIDDPLLRQLLWMSLWEMVRDCQLGSLDFLSICRRQLQLEPDLDIVDAMLQRIALAQARYVPDAVRLREAHATFDAALDSLRNARNSDGRIIWARAAIAAAASRDDVARLVELRDEPDAIGRFDFDQEMRWEIAVRAVAHGLPDALAQLDAEERRDPSDRGRRAVIRANAARPTAEGKAEAWRRIHGDGYGSFHFTRAAMQGFWWFHQAELLTPYRDRFFGEVRQVFETRDHPFARAYMLTMYPAYRSEPEVLDRSNEMLASLDGRLPTLSRQLAEAADELSRAIRVRACAER
ncbi:MAG TPA: aminopeptidase N [Candidatus Limnocylindrales bacterium]|nr:aminopeptidase N [Candidatus Limnocylindrales bacterium]